MFKFKAYDWQDEVWLTPHQLLKMQTYMQSKRDRLYNVFEDEALYVLMETEHQDCKGSFLFQGVIVETEESKRRKICYHLEWNNELCGLYFRPFRKAYYKAELGKSPDALLFICDVLNETAPTIIGNSLEDFYLLDTRRMINGGM